MSIATRLLEKLSPYRRAVRRRLDALGADLRAPDASRCHDALCPKDGDPRDTSVKEPASATCTSEARR